MCACNSTPSRVFPRANRILSWSPRPNPSRVTNLARPCTDISRRLCPRVSRRAPRHTWTCSSRAKLICPPLTRCAACEAAPTFCLGCSVGTLPPQLISAPSLFPLRSLSSGSACSPPPPLWQQMSKSLRCAWRVSARLTPFLPHRRRGSATPDRRTCVLLLVPVQPAISFCLPVFYRSISCWSPSPITSIFTLPPLITRHLGYSISTSIAILRLTMTAAPCREARC